LAGIRIRISLGDFEALQHLLREDPGFSGSYDEWVGRHSKGDRLVTVTAREFSHFCNITDQDMSYTALGLFLAHKLR
jgi:hypothetical protein